MEKLQAQMLSSSLQILEDVHYRAVRGDSYSYIASAATRLWVVKVNNPHAITEHAIIYLNPPPA